MQYLGQTSSHYDMVNKGYVDNGITSAVDNGITSAIAGLSTEWQYPTISSQFTQGEYDTRVKYKRTGQSVYFQGQIKPTASIKLDAIGIVLCTLPIGYRPSFFGAWLCQGSGTSFWTLKVEPSGSVFVARARDIGNANGVYSTVPTTYWMPFFVSFVTEEE